MEAETISLETCTLFAIGITYNNRSDGPVDKAYASETVNSGFDSQSGQTMSLKLVLIAFLLVYLL